MPAFGSYAMDRQFRGLEFAGSPPIIQDGGCCALSALKSDRITYSYPIEPFPRLAGFTSWMFAPPTPACAQPARSKLLTPLQQLSPSARFRSERTRSFRTIRAPTQILADYCNDAVSIHNNNDEPSKPREFVAPSAFMEQMSQHLENIAQQLHGRPFFEVAYDLVNEPFDHPHAAYNEAMKALTARIRATDPVHLLYIEPCEAWGAIQQIKLIEPTGDPLTAYSFHDYNFRLLEPTDRWPTEEEDISHICRQWREAFKFAIEHGTAMHCGEFGGFDSSTDDQLAQSTLMNDFFRLFDQFDMHFHYYSGRTLFERRADGSMGLSNVARAYREYFQRGEFNADYQALPRAQ